MCVILPDEGAAFVGALPVRRFHGVGPRTAEKMERLRKQWDEIYRGSQNAGKTAILEDGLSAKSIGMTADDAQFLQTRSFQRTEVRMWFGVLPFLIGDALKAALAAALLPSAWAAIKKIKNAK
jgi:phage portal protein BeeE